MASVKLLLGLPHGDCPCGTARALGRLGAQGEERDPPRAASERPGIRAASKKCRASGCRVKGKKGAAERVEYGLGLVEEGSKSGV